jgi:hypothetical protein
MKKISLSFEVLAAIIAVTILQACASTAVPTKTQCATPTLNPEHGTGGAGSPITVTIETATVGAWLCYTTNGTTPTVVPLNGKIIKAQRWNVTFPLPNVFGRTMKLQAIAFKLGLANSSVAVGTYTASH